VVVLPRFHSASEASSAFWGIGKRVQNLELEVPRTIFCSLSSCACCLEPPALSVVVFLEAVAGPTGARSKWSSSVQTPALKMILVSASEAFILPGGDYHVLRRGGVEAPSILMGVGL
jgi:hypothetical protein